MADDVQTTEDAQPAQDVAAKPAPPPAEAPPPQPEAEPTPAETAHPAYVWGTGRRKKSIARVRIRAGAGKFLINKREVDEYFKSARDRVAARSPLEAAKLTKAYDVWANVSGGGPTGQADAVMLGLARALAKAAPDADAVLREHGLLTRDARAKERKKYGRRGARRGLQWAKR